MTHKTIIYIKILLLLPVEERYQLINGLSSKSFLCGQPSFELITPSRKESLRRAEVGWREAA